LQAVHRFVAERIGASDERRGGAEEKEEVSVRKLVLLVLLPVIFLLTASEVLAYSLYVEWAPGVMSINYQFKEANDLWYSRTTGVSAARGWLENPGNTSHTLDDPGARSLGWIFCVDLKNYADNPDEFFVQDYTEANDAASQTDWISPPGDDGLRDPAGLKKAAYLANTFGPLTSSYNQRVALNVAMWEAAYGARFIYTSATVYEWFDNDDLGSYHQDFMNDVPEPSSLMLIGGALLGAAAHGWRRRKRDV
jgi:hypothetical protein